MISADEDHFVQHVEEENYFVSMTDMMVGLVFIFIILMMYYALQFRQESEQRTTANNERTEILKIIAHDLEKKGIKVKIDDIQNGVLRLPDETLFDSGQSQLKPAGVVAIRELSYSLVRILPCYTNATPRSPTCRPKSRGIKIEALFIEGNTDSDPFSGGQGLRDNLDLSVARATNTYRQLVEFQPQLKSLSSALLGENPKPILSVSGYGENRPVDTGTTPEAKAKNRRIDLRLLMASHDAPDARQVGKELGLSK